jgi:RNA-directed DNA polymerase
MLNQAFYSALARSILAGDAGVDSTAARLSATLGKRWRWLKPLAQRYLEQFGAAMRPARRDVVAFLKNDAGLRRAQAKHRRELKIAQWIQQPVHMRPAEAARAWPIPQIETIGALAEWLEISATELEWFADLRRMCARPGDGRHGAPNAHYHYRVLAKPGGSIRLIESPKTRLKGLQRRILSGILEKFPVHAAAHGFVKAHSILTFAAPHVGRDVVLRMDLKDFFPSISGPRVRALFRTAGYPEPVADRLAGVCTNSVPGTLWRSVAKGLDPLTVADARALYAPRHLPQGAPTSPALANLCAYRVDCRLAGLVESAGAVYSRYADDLAFSGDQEFGRCVERFAAQAAAILLEEGFHVHHRKTRVMRQGVRQYLAGIVVNERINVARADFDKLKAILTNCARRGLDSQNREGHPDFRSHLDGRVSFVESINPARGARLRKIFNAIAKSHEEKPAPTRPIDAREPVS